MPDATREDLQRIATESFGGERLHDYQLDAMEQVLAGRDLLAVLPTGAGKSAIYQLPAQLVDGPAVVVSPLLALQRDQVEALDRAARHARGGRDRDELRPPEPPGRLADGGPRAAPGGGRARRRTHRRRPCGHRLHQPTGGRRPTGGSASVRAVWNCACPRPDRRCGGESVCEMGEVANWQMPRANRCRG